MKAGYLKVTVLCCSCFLAITSFVGCKDECYEDDSRNERRNIMLLSPTFPTGFVSIQDGNTICNVPEDPAALAYTTPGPIESTVTCDMLRDIQTELDLPGDKWGFLLQVKGTCADKNIYTEEFKFGESQGCSGVRSMPVEAVRLGDEYRFQMCPDPHRPMNHGAAFFDFELYVRSQVYVATDECNCANDIFGMFEDVYFVRGRSSLVLEDLDLDYYFTEGCIRDPLVFFDPFMYNNDCL
jgi:hypothetical protein